MLDKMVLDPSLYFLIKAFVGYCKNSVIATKTKVPCQSNNNALFKRDKKYIWVIVIIKWL